MASIAFAAFVQSVASTGAAINATNVLVGGILSGFVDNFILLPGLFPAPDNEGPKFDGTNLQSASEGADINYCYGGASRMGGQVIWLGDIQKVENLAATTGKGGGFQVSIDEYKIDMAVAFAGNEVEGINRIHADGKLLWTDDPSISVTSTGISAIKPAAGTYTELRQTPISAFDADGLGDLYSGSQATVSGFPAQGTISPTALFFKGAGSAGATSVVLDNAGSSGSGTIATNDSFTVNHGGSIGTVRYYTGSATWSAGPAQITVTITPALAALVADNTAVTIESGVNGTYTVLSAGVLDSGNYEWARLDNAYGQTISAGSSVTVTQTGLNFDPAKMEDLTVYTGTDYQDPDPVIESWLGSGQVPGFRGRSYVVIKGLVLTDFGNRPPNLTARCTKSGSPTYAASIADIIGESGLPSDYYDASALTDSAPGYYAQGALAPSAKLQPYMVSGNIVAREEGAGVLTFYERTGVPTLAIDSAHLGAYEEGGQADYPARVTDRDDLDVPNAVTVTFLDPSKDYQAGSVTEKAPGTASGVTAQARLPLSLTSASARDIAQHALYNARTNRHRLASTLPPSYLGDGISENMLASVTVFDEDWSALTQRVEIGANWLISFEAVKEDTAIAAFAESGSAPLEVPTTAQTKAPPALRFRALDLAPLSDAHANVLGYYVAGSAYQGDMWKGAALYASSDGGTTYKFVKTIQKRATMGEATTALGDGPVGYFDRAGSVTVELDSGELESVSEVDCLKGANRMWIAGGTHGEVIGFTTATLVGTRTYTLTGLLRGLRDTRGATATHAAGDTVVLLGEGVHFIETNAASVGVQRSFKLVPPGGAVADVAAQTQRLQGYTMRPFAPVHIAGTRDVSDNLTLTWTRRTRRLADILSDTGAASADPEAAQSYSVDVMSGSTVLRTIAATTPTASYTAAEQTTDGLTPGDPVTVRVYAVSEVVGRGNYTEETV